MALHKPLIVAQLSGRIGGLVFAHNSGGQYVRVGTIPTNPNTPFQAAVRAAVAQLSAIWSQSLTQIQRDVWELYAVNVTLTNRVGDQINVSGLAMYVRSNVARLQANLPRIDDAPTVFDLGAYTAPILSNATEAGQTIDVNFVANIIGDAWALEAGGFMFTYLSRPQNPGIRFFKGPYRFASVITGDPVPPATPATSAVPFAFVDGQRIFGRHFVVTADGRLSAATFTTVLAVA